MFTSLSQKPACGRTRRAACATRLCVLLTLLPLVSVASDEIVDWDAVTWTPAGRTNLSQTYASGAGSVALTVSGNTSFLGDPTIAMDDSPGLNANNTGGIVPPEQSLYISTNYPDASNPEVTITLDFADYPDGVSNVQITVFDVDAAGAFHDNVRVTATNNTGTINPTMLTSSTQNGITGPATISGVPGVGAPSDSSDGNALFVFAQFGITQVQVVYSNIIGLGDPGFQSISIHDVLFVDPGESDLSLVKTVDNPVPNTGDPVVFTLTVNNDGPDDATGVEITDSLPSGFTYISDNGGGSYNPATGIWSVGNIPNGGNRSLGIRAAVNAVGSFNNSAEITAVEQFDPDSTPDNNVPGEDDQASASTTSATSPDAVDDFAVTDTDTPVSIGSLLNDTDPNNSPLSIIGFTDPPNGSVVLDDNGTPLDPTDDFFIYTPDSGFEGVDTYQYTIENATGGTDTATVTIVVGPTAVVLNKSVSPDTTLAGSLVTYTIAIENVGAIDLSGVEVVDTQPAGFSYLPASVRLDGVPGIVSVSGTRPLTFSGIAVTRFETVFLTYTLQAGAGVTHGQYVNRAEPFLVGSPIGNISTATVTIAADPDFDDTTIIGKVFNDRNGNGWQDPGEAGVPGVRLGAAEGLIVETDQHGRYHLAGLDGGLIERGRNFIVKADPVTLPRGTTFTTENPRVKRITRGLVNRFDFGVRLPSDTVCCETVELKLSEIFFDKNNDKVNSTYMRVLGQFAERLRASGGGIVTIEGVAAADEAQSAQALLPGPTMEIREYTLTPSLGLDQATLSPTDRADLDRIAADWSNVSNTRVEVVEHASDVVAPDNHDESVDNYALSQARAAVIAEYLRTKLDLEPARIVAVGHGPDERIAGPTTASGRAANRWVEVRMTGNVVDESTVPGAAAVRFSRPVYNRDLAERRAAGVYLVLKRMLGEELVRDVDFRVLPADETASPSVERACTAETCVGDEGYSFVVITREDAPLPSPDSSAYAGQSDRRADIRGEFVVRLANGGALWATEDPTQVEPRLAVVGPRTLPIVNGNIGAGAHFYVYNNYAAFMQSLELVIFRTEDTGRVEPVATLAVPRVNYTRVTWDGVARYYRDGDVLSYLLRAHDGAGAIDETNASEIVIREMDPVMPATKPIVRTEAAVPEGKVPAPDTSPLNGNVLVFLPGSKSERRESQIYRLTPRFGSRRADLSARDKVELDSIASSWRGATGIRIEAVGHTDNVPIAASNRREFVDNQALSEARAESVADHVARRLGVPISNVKTSGRASGEPVDTNDTATGRARNRRVELAISGERVMTLPPSEAFVRLVNPDTGGEEPIQYSIEEAENFLKMKYEIESNVADPESILTLPVESERDSLTGFSAQDSAKALQDVYGCNDLAQQNIPIHGSRVRLHGRDIGDNSGLRINGDPLPLDTSGNFAVEYLLPVGSQQFDVAFVDDSGVVSHETTVPIEVTGESMYVVAMIDLTLSSSDLSGSVEQLASEDRYEEDFLAEGRIAFYLKGKIKGKYLVTAQLDTGEEELSDILSQLDEKNPRSVFRRLDPDRYYPVYGDDSTTIADTDSQGRLYVRAQWDKSEARWGNYHTGISGTEFAQYNRSLYGGRYHHRSVATTAHGDNRLEGVVFLSETQAALGHSEFLGTGGSLYYLKHSDVLPGSEKVHVEVRDRDSGRVLENKALVRGADYEIDEIQGRLILARPLAQVAELVGPSLIQDSALDGDSMFLLADYEYVPDGFSADKVTVGGRGKYWINDAIAVGATYVDENRGGDDYRLGGFDVTLKSGRDTYLKAEIADTDNTQAERFFSDDGGLDFTALNDPATAGRSGTAVSVEGRANLSEWLKMDNDWVIGAWWRDTEEDFSVARRDTGVDTTEYGIEANGHVGDRLKLATRLSIVERDLLREDRAFSAQADYRLTDRGKIAGELRLVEEIVPGDLTDDATLLALRYTHRLFPNVEIWGTGQVTLDMGADYDNNDRASIGTRVRLGNQTTLAAEIGDGHRGAGGSIEFDHEVNSQHRIYGTYTHSTDRSDPLDGRQFAVGHRSQISNQTTLFNEMQFIERPGQAGIAHGFGLDFSLGRGWQIGLATQTGSLDGPGGTTDRDSGSLSTGYRNDSLRWVAKVEYRDDNGASDRRQWLLTNRVDLSLSDAARLLTRINVSDTADQRDPLGNATFAEGSIGYAYRPVAHDRWNLLAKYTFLYDLPGLHQLDSGTDQRSEIFSIEGIHRLSRRWDLGGKLAQRQSDLRQRRDDGDWFESTANFAALRARYHLLRAWDGMVEYRLLDVEETDNVRRGYLIAFERHLGAHLKLGLGFNFTDFSDELGELDFDHRGFFLNAVGKY